MHSLSETNKNWYALKKKKTLQRIPLRRSIPKITGQSPQFLSTIAQFTDQG